MPPYWCCCGYRDVSSGLRFTEIMGDAFVEAMEQVTDMTRYLYEQVIASAVEVNDTLANNAAASAARTC